MKPVTIAQLLQYQIVQCNMIKTYANRDNTVTMRCSDIKMTTHEITVVTIQE